MDAGTERDYIVRAYATNCNAGEAMQEAMISHVKMYSAAYARLLVPFCTQDAEVQAALYSLLSCVAEDDQLCTGIGSSSSSSSSRQQQMQPGHVSRGKPPFTRAIQ